MVYPHWRFLVFPTVGTTPASAWSSHPPGRMVFWGTSATESLWGLSAMMMSSHQHLKSASRRLSGLLGSSLALAMLVLLVPGASANAQEKPKQDSGVASIAASRTVLIKKQAAQASSSENDGDLDATIKIEKESPQEIRKRDQWF